MYDIILDSILEEMNNFGLISTIIISSDYHESMNKKQIEHLESLLDISGGVKWLISNEKQEYFRFRYSFEPMEFEE